MGNFRRLMGFLRPYRRELWGSMVFAWLAIGMTVLIPVLIGRAVNAIEHGEKSNLLPLALAIVGASVLRLGLTVVRRLVAGKVSLAVEFDLRQVFYAHLQRLELGFFDSQQTGQLMSRATVDLQSIRFFLGYGLIFITQSLLTIVLASAVMFAMDPLLAAIALLPAPFVVFTASRYNRVSRPALQEVQQRIAELTAEAEENISGIRIVKAFAREEYQLHRFRRAVARVFDQSIYSTRLQAFFSPLIGFLPQIGIALVLLVGGREVISHSLSLGAFTAFYVYLVMLAGPMRMLGITMGMAQRAVASGNRMFEILDRDPAIESPPGAPALPEGGGEVELRGVTLRYDGAAPALADVDLHVEAGRTVALVGPSGSGKTSLVALIARLYDPSEGTVLVDGVDVREVDVASLRSEIAFVADDSFLFTASVAENIAYAHPEATREEVEAAAQARPGGPVHPRAARRVRDAGRRAGPDAVGRAAPARRDRPRPARRPPHPDPRRRHLLGRRAHRVGDQVRPPGSDGRAHHLHHRPPPLDRLAGRRSGGDGRRQGRRLRHPRAAAGALRLLRRDRRARARRLRLPAAGPRAERADGAAVSEREEIRAEEEMEAEQAAYSPEPNRFRSIFLLFAALWRLVRGQDQRARKVRWMIGLLRPYRGRMTLMFVALLIETGAGLAPPYLAGRAIDVGIKTGDLSALDLTVAAFLAAALLYALGTYAETYLVGWVGTRALQDLRERLFSHIQSMSIGFFTRRSPGVLISRITNDIEALNQLVTDGVVTMFSSTLTLIGVVVILLALDVKLALITFLTFPLLMVASLVFRIVSAGAYKATQGADRRGHRLSAGDA